MEQMIAKQAELDSALSVSEKIPVSVYVICKNEEQNIGALLDQLVAFDEVVLVDCGSTDNTLSIANTYTNVYTTYHAWNGFSEQKAYALSLCNNEWVLNLDADEELSPDYLNEMLRIIRENKADALESSRILFRKGRKPKNFIKDDRLIRFFRKSAGSYKPARVHERIEIRGQVASTQAAILHHENLTFCQRMQKSNQYSLLKAQDKFAQGKRCNRLWLALVFPWSFLQCYIGKGCFLDGCDGLLTSMNFAYYNFMKYAKLWELTQMTGKATVTHLKPVGGVVPVREK